LIKLLLYSLVTILAQHARDRLINTDDAQMPPQRLIVTKLTLSPAVQ